MNKLRDLLSKTLVVGVLVLFIGVGMHPAFAVTPNNTDYENDVNIEPIDYLFQTIIDIANNPDVKNLLEQHHNELFRVDIDRTVYRKLLLRNPRLLFSILFTKSFMSIEYLDNCYNKGIEITNIPGDDNALEILKSIEITDMGFFNELNNIIINDKELSGRLLILEEMNKEYVSDLSWNFPIICTILTLIFMYEGIKFIFFWEIFFKYYYKTPTIIGILATLLLKTMIIMAFSILLIEEFGCDWQISVDT